MVTLKTLQRFIGKAVSLSLVMPSCKLYVRKVFPGIVQMARSPRGSIKINDKLSSELQHWRFLDKWTDCSLWCSELHYIVHSPSCPGIPCECPPRLVAGTIHSLLRKLRAKEYLKFVRNEQASLAVPVLFIKFSKLIAYLRDLIVNSRSLSRVNKYILAEMPHFSLSISLRKTEL